MSELLLHWLWQKQLYHTEALRTLSGEAVEVLLPGQATEKEGPDFVGAEVRIGGMRWVGSVEIDRTPAQWYAHRHHENPQYRTVVLHVVWEAPSSAVTLDDLGRSVPILPLAPAVPEAQLRRLLPEKAPFPCAGLARLAPEALWHTLYDSWAEHRLRARHQTYRSTEELFQAFWEALAYSFGVPQGAAFRQIAQALPWAWLQRYAETLPEKEAALLGVAGFLEDLAAPKDPYEETLLSQWRYLVQKHGLHALALRWRPTRPAAAPSLRLAMLAALLDSYPRLAQLLETPPAQLPLPSPYWQQHWNLQKKLRTPLQKPSAFLLRNVQINAIYPFAIYYLRALGRVEAALEVLAAFRALPPEIHKYTRIYARWAYPAQNAWQTQGQLELWREACMPQACLRCQVGQFLRQL